MEGCLRLPADRGAVADRDVDRPSSLLVQQDVADELPHADVRPDSQFGEVVGSVTDLLGGSLHLFADLVVGDVGDESVLDLEPQRLAHPTVWHHRPVDDVRPLCGRRASEHLPGREVREGTGLRHVAGVLVPRPVVDCDRQVRSRLGRHPNLLGAGDLLVDRL